MAEERTKGRKRRVDQLLVERGLAPSRARARALVMAGRVSVGGRRVDKAGAMVDEAVELEVAAGREYVSRGGLKLEAVLERFGIDMVGAVVIDVGASTGGFTDCVLRRGAARVYAVDVGYGQLDWKLRRDERVVLLERVNARYLGRQHVGEEADAALFDVSFISLTKVVPPVLYLLREGGVVVALVKPQFEVGPRHVGKGGVVRDERRRLEAVASIERFFAESGLEVAGTMASPLSGAKGNQEYFIVAYKRSRSPREVE